MDTSTALPGARTRAVAIASVVALVALGLAWELWLAPTGNGTLAVKVVPLLLPLPGLLRNRLYTFRWLTLMVWLYFIEGVVSATGDRGISALLAGIEVVLCLVLFIACALHVRGAVSARRKATACRCAGR
jgi:uncharacterized membrane protein